MIVFSVKIYLKANLRCGSVHDWDVNAARNIKKRAVCPTAVVSEVYAPDGE